jgi:outer membrane protein
MISRLLIVVFSLALTSQIFSQQKMDSVLTFQKAVKIALQNNVTLNTQRNNLVQSRVNKTYRTAQLGPQASINGNLYESNGNRFIQQEGKVVNATVRGAQASLGVSQPIFGGFSNFNFARQSSAQLDAQAEFVNRTTQDIIALVANQYLQVLLDQELLKIAQENVVSQKATLEQVKGQVELGSKSPVDEYNQQAQVSNAELRVAQQELTLTNSKILLFQSLVIDPTQKIRIEEPAWDVNAIGLDNLELQTMVGVAMERRSDLRQYQELEKAARLSMHANKGNFLPSLSAFYNNGSAFNQLKGADKTDPSYRNFNQQFFTDNRSNSFGLSLNIPIFGGFQNRFFYIQSKVAYQNAQLQTKNREVVIKSDVMRAFENFESVKKAYQAGATGLDASTQALNLERERYQLGITAFVDFVNANRTFVQAQTDMAQAKYRLLFQKILMDYANGTLKIEDIP